MGFWPIPASDKQLHSLPDPLQQQKSSITSSSALSYLNPSWHLTLDTVILYTSECAILS
jgi:hypothetical protein